MGLYQHTAKTLFMFPLMDAELATWMGTDPNLPQTPEKAGPCRTPVLTVSRSPEIPEKHTNSHIAPKRISPMICCIISFLSALCPANHPVFLPLPFHSAISLLLPGSSLTCMGPCTFFGCCFMSFLKRTFSTHKPSHNYDETNRLSSLLHQCNSSIFLRHKCLALNTLRHAAWLYLSLLQRIRAFVTSGLHLSNGELCKELRKDPHTSCLVRLLLQDFYSYYWSVTTVLILQYYQGALKNLKSSIFPSLSSWDWLKSCNF